MTSRVPTALSQQRARYDAVDDNISDVNRATLLRALGDEWARRAVELRDLLKTDDDNEELIVLSEDERMAMIEDVQIHLEKARECYFSANEIAVDEEFDEELKELRDAARSDDFLALTQTLLREEGTEDVDSLSSSKSSLNESNDDDGFDEVAFDEESDVKRRKVMDEEEDDDDNDVNDDAIRSILNELKEE